jgi:hypothetical protein
MENGNEVAANVTGHPKTGHRWAGQNELRVFALRSRRKNLVGLNRVGSTWGFYGDERGRWHASMARCG